MTDDARKDRHLSRDFLMTGLKSNQEVAQILWLWLFPLRCSMSSREPSLWQQNRKLESALIPHLKPSINLQFLFKLKQLILVVCVLSLVDTMAINLQYIIL